MRRAVVAAALATLAFSACAGQERPEGIVERWLLALNQGAAGEPGRYAPDAASEEVLPGWEHLDPGELDVVEVAPGGTPREDTCREATSFVPFRVVQLDGSELRSVACVAGARVTRLTDRIGSSDPMFPSEGGPEGLMRLARLRRPD